MWNKFKKISYSHFSNKRVNGDESEQSYEKRPYYIKIWVKLKALLFLLPILVGNWKPDTSTAQPKLIGC